MTKAIESFLENRGFNANDVRVYLDIYTHGQSFASSVAARTSIDRTTVYSCLKRLLKRGVIAQTTINEVNAYVSIEPDIFVDSVDARLDGLVAERKMAVEFVEELKTLRKSVFNKPRIRVYEGEQAIINLYEETLKRGGRQKAFIKVDRLPDGLRDFFRRKYVESKKRHAVFSQVIAAESEVAKRYRAKDSLSNRLTRLVARHPFEMHAEILLFGESEVAIVDFHEQLWGLVIDSGTLYKSIEAMFDFMWADLA